jgi:transposase
MQEERYIQSMNRRQLVLFPGTIDEYILEGNPVRFIDAFADSLDMVSIGFTHAIPMETGRPPYDPGDLLKLYIYGYLNRLRSSRKLERECTRNLEVMWLMKRLTPDFKTIADFRKENASILKDVFRMLNSACDDFGLFGKELIGIDGSKFRAVNSKNNCPTEEELEHRLKKMDERIEQHMA